MYSSPPVSENHDTTRLTVADILSTMASSVDAMTPTTLSILDGLTGVPTRTTPTLTPTTLRNIEQTFMDLAANQISHEHEAGFVPPLVPSNTLPYSTNAPSNYTVTVTTTTQGYTTQDVKPWVTTTQSQIPVSTTSTRSTARRMSVGSNSSSSNGSSYSSNTVSYSSSTRKSNSGGRRKEDRDLDDGNPDEVVKRKLRRERNKLAAARCRKRRLDHTMALQQEVDLWEEKKQGIQNEIRQLQKEKEELEVLLETHRSGPNCKHRRTAGTGGSNLPTFCGVRVPPAKNNIQPVIKQELQESDDSYSSESENNHLDAPYDIHQQQHLAPAAHRSLLPTQQQPQQQPQQPQRMEFTKPAPRPRPTSLPVASPFNAQPRSSTAATSNEIAGISITTPSSGIPGLNFESLMDGGTGLTPVVPTPSCSSQQMRSSALPVDLSSPESVNRKLVSL